MPTPPEQVLLDLIARGEPFDATSDDGSISLRVDAWIPCVCTAVHHGHRLRAELQTRTLLEPAERLYEEDPHTGGLIAAMPIALVAHDSRYEYDLNRPLARCVYTYAWGKQVWRRPPTARQLEQSREKHRAFYRVLEALVAAVEQRSGACLVIDAHSYNMSRHGPAAPVFNLGTSQIDLERWGPVVDELRQRLLEVELPGLAVDCHLDTVFQGRGYLIAHVNARFTDTLVIPFEVGKVFMKEESGELYPLLFEALAAGLKRAFGDTAAFFARRHTRRRRAGRHDMLASTVDPALLDVDRELSRLARGVETLMYVSPVNVAAARRRFLRRGEEPVFEYRPFEHDPYRFRALLYRLPVETIADPEIQQLYHAVMDSLATRIDLVTSVGSERFLYNSLRYYGEPDDQDVANARFILHATASSEAPEEPLMDAGEAQRRLKAQAEAWGMSCRVEKSRRIVAKALVNNTRRTLYLNAQASFTESQLQALAHHELGVHMATTLNARLQRLRIFSLGLPVNTLTQEGLAILAEYLSGNLTLRRLRDLALRVVAIDAMLRYGDFRRTVSLLAERHGLAPEAAFDLAVRVHRGGGLTKDYLYLRGLREAYACWRERPLDNLLVGKTSLAWLGLLDELRARDLVAAPHHVPAVFAKPVAPDPVVEFVVRSIQPPRRSVG
jgi:uncharacterized protein (TIGR02421 family)